MIKKKTFLLIKETVSPLTIHLKKRLPGTLYLTAFSLFKSYFYLRLHNNYSSFTHYYNYLLKIISLFKLTIEREQGKILKIIGKAGLKPHMPPKTYRK